MALPPSVNFSFLAPHGAHLVALAAAAERSFADDPNTTLIKLRQLGEQLGRAVAAYVGITIYPGEAHADVLQKLQRAGAIRRDMADLFHGLRKSGNAATHDITGEPREALHQLKMTREIALWFHRSFGQAKGFTPGPFVPPPDPEAATHALRAELEAARAAAAQAKLDAEQARALAEQEARARLSAEERAAKEAEDRALIEQLALEAQTTYTQNLETIRAEAAAKPELVKERVASAHRAETKLVLDEAATRRQIDKQLRDAGWEVDSETLKFASGARPQAGKNRAIAEWPTEGGRADYVLFRGLEAYAIVEAKRQAKDVPSVLEQAKEYARTIKLIEGAAAAGGPWGAYRVPFLFATNGRKYLKQIETKSGIWYVDARKPTNLSRAVDGFATPDGLRKRLRQDIEAADEALRNTAVDILGLRPFQRDAVRAVEEALAGGKRSALLSMATGTGKTRTAIALAYRLLEAKRVRRILFVVDRTSLGDQAADAFREARIQQNRTFHEIYGIKGLDEVKVEKKTYVHFATIQALIGRVFDPDEPPPPIDQYDCIIVDECHRGYALDRDLSEAELEFRSQDEYVSQYRRALEHFDAVRIGLTATPALHTAEIFGRPVFNYGFRQAVVDGVLVDKEPTIQIVTALAESGIKFEKGAEVDVWNPETDSLDKATLEDELHVDLAGFNRRVITESFNRVVCHELAARLPPMGREKTLVFCVTTDHADLVVKLLKEELQARYGEVQDDEVVRITASPNAAQLIRRFKTKEIPRIVVTVDLLTTGIDVPEICNLVFLRRVGSRILYEQMLGRATRKCDELGKESFRVFDAVDQTSLLAEKTDMKPVVQNPNITFEKLVEELAAVEALAHQEVILEQLIAKLQRKKRRLKGDRLETFEVNAGMSVGALIEMLKSGPPADAAAWFKGRGHLAKYLDDSTGDGAYRPIVHHGADRVLVVRHVYPDGSDKGADYLERFQRFLKERGNELPALLAVTRRPRDLKRKDLNALRLALDANGYNESSLQQAVRETTNADVAASILGFIRRATLGEGLLPYSERVDRAVQKILQSRPWDEAQRKWLVQLGKALKADVVVDREALDQGRFKDLGGSRMLGRIFKDEGIEHVLGELHEEIWRTTG